MKNNYGRIIDLIIIILVGISISISIYFPEFDILKLVIPTAIFLVIRIVDCNLEDMWSKKE